ncbi:hypothetical protein E1A91_A07G138500v1 [Gossypium mustelinum]|uniref:Uncharacterized protein n=1 Tax=Gossypium mustelinum TaxID=34275 RepID=A0A5D2YL15_GOSMU|nr:hypothetical protein E1A91_A07G138500v1 [Gossypium mustelinum]
MRHRFMFSTKTKLRNPKLNTQSLKTKSKQNKTSFPSHSAEPKKRARHSIVPFASLLGRSWVSSASHAPPPIVAYGSGTKETGGVHWSKSMPLKGSPMAETAGRFPSPTSKRQVGQVEVLPWQLMAEVRGGTRVMGLGFFLFRFVWA